MRHSKPKDKFLRNDQRWCPWCAEIFSFRRFDMHLKACQHTHSQVTVRPQSLKINPWKGKRHPIVNYSPETNMDNMNVNEDIEMIGQNSEYESEEEDPAPASRMSKSADEYPPNISSTSQIPESFIEIIHHPHSGQRTSTIISLDNPADSWHGHQLDFLPSSLESQPWAPFRTRSDFEFSEMVVKQGLRHQTISQLLDGFNGRWATESSLTLRNYADYQASLAAARQFTIEFRAGETIHTFEGRLYVFKFRYRDPWQWILDLVTDTTLVQYITWYPIEKYLHHRGRITRMYDELSTGTRWWDIQDTLPQGTGTHHVYLPLHLWLDKSNVAKTVKKHLILLRPGFLPSTIRNGSGNGGGVLIGYMDVEKHENEEPDIEDDTLDSVAYAQFQREVYHEICRTVFSSLHQKSRHGEAVTCGDQITRILYPGFMIGAVDGEEGYCLCGTRGPQANHPCARCLVPKKELNRLTQTFEARTQQSMMTVYAQSSKLPLTSRETLLRSHGLHFVQNSFWDMANSDPYQALSYDMLHAIDLGEWGKHQWPLIRDEILNKRQKGELNRNMQQVPRWRGLKHFDPVTTVEFSDGNGYRDILYSILPCVVNILPPKSSIVQMIRLCAVIRTIASLNPVTEEYIEYLEKCLPKYEKICSCLSLEFGKNYNYPKHHSLIHLIEDLRAKGATINYTTRPGEGFQQEVRQAYKQTNFKNTDSQMTRIDENQEAIARIRTSINIHDKRLLREVEELNQTDGDDCPKPVVSEKHWSLGSFLRVVSVQTYAKDHAGQPGFRFFEKRLRLFLSEYIPPEEQPAEPLQINVYRCLYLRYRSLEDWKEKQDILRCNPKFHEQAQYDFVLINTNPPSYGRLLSIFSCEGPGEIHHDIAFIRNLKPSSWRPKTKWDGCQVFEENDTDFFLIKYLVRGCHFIPTFSGPSKGIYLNDLIDGDAFIRFFLEERLSQSQL